MPLPYNRPWLMEIADQQWCPPYLRIPAYEMLAYIWTHRIPIFQSKSPYERAAQVLERIIESVNSEDGRLGGSLRNGDVRVVDFGSGAGGPLRKIERWINRRRADKSKPPTQFYLTDLYPMPRSALPNSSPSLPSLVYLPESVDALRAPKSVTSKRHLRTFFLSFHHFNEEQAREIIVDAMRSAEGICIFELQECDFESVMMIILMLAPLTWIFMPFQRPNIKTLIFTYLIPLIPFILVLDGLISVYRTRSPSHILHLANLATLSLALEGEDKVIGDMDWKWEHGTERHTWPFGRLVWVVGRRDWSDNNGNVTGTEAEAEEESYSEAEHGI
ncbi:hypothetical protein I308_105988 [Cryptococcus tetragattii IND107]|uniref:Uncharacterized protein n=1 Tax=Cryptococcus tetragattii IND107 TaxID=1296105 RepID=A0ABR3BKQ6_9TREE